MKIALLGDLHLGKSLYGFDLSPYIKRAMWDFLGLCRRKKVAVAVQLGDVFDRPTPTEEQRKVVAQWCNEFDRAGIRLYIIVGNHDVLAKKESPSALQYLKSSSLNSNVWVVDRPLVLYPRSSGVAVNLAFLPFPSPGIYRHKGEYEEDIEAALEDDDQRHQLLTFAHLNVTGAKLGNQEFVYRGADYSLPKWPGRIFCGHVHKPQVLRSVTVIGAAERLRFDETDQVRCFGLVTVDLKDRFSPHGINFRKVLRPDALNLVELEIDASSINGSRKAPSTGEVISDIASTHIRVGFNRAVIKVTPFVDHQTVVDWGEVRDWLYSDGAEHVHVAPPVSVGEKRNDKSEKKQQSKDPVKAAERFIKERVRGRKKKADLMDQFLKVLRELGR